MQKTKKIIISILIFLILIVPALSLADGLVPCDNSAEKLCDFNAFMALINKVIHFILFNLVIPIAAIMFAYAGFLLITAGGEVAGARTKAKGIFFNAVFGLIIAVAAFLIIRTVLSILGYEGSWLGFNPLSDGI
ncbi:MAG: hypothetical protein WC671_00860 [Candidatus Paceibacterota bacterium]|jgi:cytochrome c biogenesis factor